MNNEIEQLAEQHGMTVEFVTWFFSEKKAGCGNVWLMMLAAMWEGWKGRAAESTAAVATIEKCREVSGCPEGVDLQDHLRQMAVENLTMLRLLTDISENHVEYFSEGEGYMFAGVPLDYVSEINMYVSRDVNAENPFPATDRIYAGIKADGRVEGAHFVANRMLAAWDAGFIVDTAKNAADIARMILTSTEFMADAPEGDFDRSFADGILEDIAQQLREGAK